MPEILRPWGYEGSVINKEKGSSSMSEATEAAEIQARIFDLETRIEAGQAEQSRQLEAMLAEERSARAQEKLEAEALALVNYRERMVRQAVATQSIAPQFVDFIRGTSKEEIDAAVEHAKAATAEILEEVAGQGAPTEQFTRTTQQPMPRDRGLPAGLSAEEIQKAQDGTLSLQDYAALRSRLGLGKQDNGLFG
jgi:hypothetical protein